MNKSGKWLGSILVIIGVLFLLKNFDIFNIWDYINIGYIIGHFWPAIFLMLPGFLFHVSFFSGKERDAGILVPGGILLVLGAAFQINMLFGGWSITWPIYIFSVAFGLFELYAFGNRDKGLLIPIGILSGLSVIFFLSFSLNRLLSFNTRPFVLPVILIGIGLLIFFSGKNGGSRQNF